jgi:hypothetical protein
MTKCLGGLLFARRKLLSKLRQSDANVCVGERVNYRSIQFGEDIFGCSFGCPDCIPHRDITRWARRLAERQYSGGRRFRDRSRARRGSLKSGKGVFAVMRRLLGRRPMTGSGS